MALRERRQARYGSRHSVDNVFGAQYCEKSLFRDGDAT